MNDNRTNRIAELENSFLTVFRTFRKDINDLFSDDVPANEFGVLNLLKDKEYLTASELAGEMKVSSSHITGVTDRLIKKDLITRERSLTDRRIVYVKITEKGQAVAEKLSAIRRDYYKEKFSGLSDLEMENMIDYLNRMS
ncbi:DNA-binding transcriptional regulator, MarR family [Fictibacillus solisalsi]|uniref:DNA-binding transcriptional regulator, MarR family n=1 Tax=Fictibacillus solisalsi TaxID=459525 RepID=A0A1G9UD88_9BACL|nr:MarR family transcriptional regulator [Fictibacillus solisalsi]SDM57842.1 DNA-binding transcriptional regulator, MarR family [Fictibacillus solisalsi]